MVAATGGGSHEVAEQIDHGSMKTTKKCDLDQSLERVPIKWSHLIGTPLNLEELEHVGIE